MTATTNVLIALKNILDRNSCRLTPIFRSNGLANTAGDSLEYFIKDMFCTGGILHSVEEDKNKIYDQYLSWKGNSSNFPDFIVKQGVGVEPKKMNGKGTGSLSLNSSFPKAYIYPDTQNLPPKELINEREWDKKSIIYAVGNLDRNNDKLLRLWLAYGNTFIAEERVYSGLKSKIKDTIENLTNAEFVPSVEFGRIKKVDPLGNTNLRLRGMWELAHPEAVFQKFLKMRDIPQGATKINLIISEADYRLIEKKPDLSLYIESGKLIKHKVLIPNPNYSLDNISVYLFETYTD
ncbi:NgoPII family restriction endonuclease [Listeria booriae]|uniref:NgoPII family restriction endonuclease n=1 Tax=Listeria booriae TaxID=1552123 RepID=A0A841WX99_9LIST|nr:NgoPII family restriction endonuclease [Listeria booriae]MBC1235429.1 NgoPII family restriction endonuclease [Listeria booriae]MBC1247219.1 NgoPII family restriction endonuclease [Listeria booriae]MBC1317564.1 NgoPII family restriction endonuclease [Listeria booriae]